MRRTVVIAAIAALTLTGCGKKTFPPEVYQYVCSTFDAAAEVEMLGSAPRLALDGLQEVYGLSASDAADAIDIARREQCP